MHVNFVLLHNWACDLIDLLRWFVNEKRKILLFVQERRMFVFKNAGFLRSRTQDVCVQERRVFVFKNAECCVL